jgi:hypothetical protein
VLKVSEEVAMTLGTRIGIGIVGVLLLLVGWTARSIETSTSSLGYIALQAPDGTIGAYQPDDSYDGPFEIEEAGDGEFQVVEGGQNVLFTGPQKEAAFWIETRGVEPEFTGTSGEVRAWIADQEAAEDAENMFWPLTLMISGGVVLLAAVALGRD